MDTTEKIEAARKKKEDGNALFKAGKYLRASKKYDKASCWPRHFVCSLLISYVVSKRKVYFNIGTCRGF